MRLMKTKTPTQLNPPVEEGSKEKLAFRKKPGGIELDLGWGIINLVWVSLSDISSTNAFMI